MATKLSVKKEAVSDEVVLPKPGQVRPVLGRFRLQVDRQIKRAFDTAEEAEQAGAAIKKAFPVVQVSVYDAQESAQKMVD